ncbi:MAG: hypothetical protein K8L91_22835 [Anaerolineae bacterium]|nr:hypothetical protein [Anaerolineae bacterium]
MSEKKPTYEELLQLVANLRQQITALRPEAGTPDAFVRENALRMIDHMVPEIREAQMRSTSKLPPLPTEHTEGDKARDVSATMRDTLPALPKTAPLKKPDSK